MQHAIIGAGIAGSAAASLLAEQGHAVTLFEQSPELASVGAGIMIQPSGQRVLNRMGLLEAVEQESSRLTGMTAHRFQGRPLVDLQFHRLRPDYWALGVHRGRLFRRLLDRCRANDVRIITGFRAESIDCALGYVTSATGETEGPFDSVIIADGSNSALRQSVGLTARTIEYDYGALWTTGLCSEPSDRLLQMVNGTRRLAGILPIGAGEASFFWGLPKRAWESPQRMAFAQWRDEVITFMPATAPLVAGLSDYDSLTFGSYRSVHLPRCHMGRVLFIGDAAHATSPHLGQGANLALEDADCLARAMASHDAIEGAFRSFVQERRRKVRFYRQLTALLSPFFQSDSRWRGPVRDCVLPVMPRLPWVGHVMLHTLSGTRGGWLG